MDFHAKLYDGSNAEGIEVRVYIQSRGLTVKGAPDSLLDMWDADNSHMLYVDKFGARVDLGHKDNEDARLIIQGEEIRDRLAPALPYVLGPLPGTGWRAGFRITGYLVAFIVVCIIGLWQFERILPSLLPKSYIEGMGRESVKTTHRIFGGQCRTREATRALDKMLMRVRQDQQLHTDIKISVANSSTVNAMALPGGYIIIMDGLIQQAESPEELAGVLAHEIGHVKKKHVVRGLARSMGLSLFLAMMGGGTSIDFAEQMLALGFSRSMEDEADIEAMEMMQKAQLSVKPMANFFKKLSKANDEEIETTQEAGNIESYLRGAAELLSTHPNSEARAARFKKADWPTVTPVLSNEEWEQLRSACAE